MLGAWGLTEPGSGSDAAGMITFAEDKGDHYLVNGTKTFITNGASGGVFVCVCLTDRDAPGTHGISRVTRSADSCPVSRPNGSPSASAGSGAAASVVFRSLLPQQKSFQRDAAKETAVMSSGLLVLVGLSTLASGTDSYADAYRQTTETGRPLVVLVGAKWCGACKTMERKVIPKVRQQDLFRRISFARVDLDRQRALGRKLTRGGPIPQLLMFRRTRDGWRLSRLRGAHSARTVEAFIRRGLPRDGEAEQAEAAPAKEQNDGEAAAAKQAANQPSKARTDDSAGKMRVVSSP